MMDSVAFEGENNSDNSENTFFPRDENYSQTSELWCGAAPATLVKIDLCSGVSSYVSL